MMRIIIIAFGRHVVCANMGFTYTPFLHPYVYPSRHCFPRYRRENKTAKLRVTPTCGCGSKSVFFPPLTSDNSCPEKISPYLLHPGVRLVKQSLTRDHFSLVTMSLMFVICKYQVSEPFTPDIKIKQYSRDSRVYVSLEKF